MGTSTGKTGKTTAPAYTSGNDKIDLTSYGVGAEVKGGLGADDFVFGATRKESPYLLTDFQSMNEGNDQLDLSLVFSATAIKKMSGANISKYVQVTADGKLLIDTSGGGTFNTSQPWAILSNVEGEQIHLRIGNFNGYVIAGDATAPVVNPNPTGDTGESNTSFAFEYSENSSAGTIVGTAAATDNVGVTQWRFASGSADATDPTLSVDGYFHIGSDGKITLTAAGVTSFANDYEDTHSEGSPANEHSYFVQAGDKAGNWSSPVEVHLNETNVDDHAPEFADADGFADSYNPDSGEYTFSYVENQTSTTAAIGAVAATDADGSVTYSIKTNVTVPDVGGVTVAYAINSTTGEITLTAAGLAAFTNDYEDATPDNVHQIVVSVSDGVGNPVDVTVNFNETDDTSDNGGGPAPAPIHIFVTAESGAYFDSNDDGLFDYTGDWNDTQKVDWSSVDFSKGDYVVEFIGWGGEPWAPIDLSGFDAGDKIIVNFSHDWVGTGWVAPTYIAEVQRGTGDVNGGSGFMGYTYSHYSQTYDRDANGFGTFARSHYASTTFGNPGGVWGSVGVGTSRSKATSFLNLKAFYTNHYNSGTTTRGPLAGPAASSQAHFVDTLASWTASTKIARSQIEIVWPNAMWS